jgi:hypothetical protein
VKTTANNIFGGYTSQSWDSSNSYKTDHQSFLFSVDKLAKYDIKNSHTQAIYCHSTLGPTFGNGYDICISDNSKANSSSYTYAG